MPNFNGMLNSNELFASLFNLIISQQVFSDNIAGTKSSLVDMARVDGSLYGDQKLYYSTDVLSSVPWLNDAEAQNLLAIHRPEAPKVQAIVLNQFRQISLTVDNYLSKRAFSDQGAFASFNSVILGWVRETKRVYDSTLYNSYIGTANSLVGKQNITIALAEDDAGTEATNRLQAQAIAKQMADLLVELEDVSRDYNDYGHLRSYNSDDLLFVWNSEWVNKINKFDLPTIFNKEGLMDKFAQHTLPARYFGNVNTSSGTTGGSNITIRSLIEKDYGSVHVFPGDLLPGNTQYNANETYGEDPSIICKVMHRRSVPIMSSMEVGSSFFNPKSLSENHYLTWGYNTLEYLKNYPFITIKGQSAT